VISDCPGWFPNVLRTHPPICRAQLDGQHLSFIVPKMTVLTRKSRQSVMFTRMDPLFTRYACISDNPRTHLTNRYRSGHINYYNIHSDFGVISKRMNQVGPDRPPEAPLLTDDVWDFIQICWRDHPVWRPDADQVRNLLKELISQYSQEELLSTLPPEELLSPTFPPDEFEAGLSSTER